MKLLVFLFLCLFFAMEAKQIAIKPRQPRKNCRDALETGRCKASITRIGADCGGPSAASKNTRRDRDGVPDGIVAVVAKRGFLNSCSSYLMSIIKKSN
ncbi:hypothetical protein Y032_0558g3433 [Ancylostoma ceylanicum]|nr:hypothetical protein Y032_0558g3433 [Ancylostoma ceylanicum]